MRITMITTMMARDWSIFVRDNLVSIEYGQLSAPYVTAKKEKR